MLPRLLLIGLWWLLASSAAAQSDALLAESSPEYRAAYPLLRDSLAALNRYARAGQLAAVERLATALLTRYPGRIGYVPGNTTPKVTRYFFPTEYPQVVYARRAEVRRQRGDVRGAAADLTQALRYGELAYPDHAREPDENHYYHNPAVAFLRDTYYARALLRLDALRDPAGGCQDLGLSYQLDTARASSPRWRGCPLPAARVARHNTSGYLARLMRDSVAVAQRLIDQGRLRRAEQIVNQLAAGRVGAYVRVPMPLEPLRYLRSQLARQRHDYRRAAAYLDTLVGNESDFYGNPRYRYARGTLRIDHLGDRDGGCRDLRWVYDHDTTRTAPGHPRWRGCPLPSRKAPVGAAEWAAHRAAYLDSVARATALCQAGRGDRGLPIFARLLATAEAGAYAPLIEYYQPPGQLRRSSYPRLERNDLPRLARDARSRAYESLRDYARAVADLDTLIRDFTTTDQGKTDWYCRRGVLLADFLHDQPRACRDLTECQRRGGTPPGDKPWRGCQIEALTLNYRFKHTAPVYALFGNLNTTTTHLGGFVQGRALGLEVGRQLSEDGKDLVNYGPSIGLELAAQPTAPGRNLLLAPKLSYEAELLLAGGRLDLAYYLGAANGRPVGDLRLTPQIGVSLLARLNVFYGYAIPVAGTEADFLGRHRLSIYWNFLQPGKFGG